MKRRRPGPLAASRMDNGSIIPYLFCDFKKKHEKSAYPENTPPPGRRGVRPPANWLSRLGKRARAYRGNHKPCPCAGSRGSAGRLGNGHFLAPLHPESRADRSDGRCVEHARISTPECWATEKETSIFSVVQLSLRCRHAECLCYSCPHCPILSTSASLRSPVLEATHRSTLILRLMPVHRQCSWTTERFRKSETHPSHSLSLTYPKPRAVEAPKCKLLWRFDPQGTHRSIRSLCACSWIWCDGRCVEHAGCGVDE
jgi:hypothetical protein